MDRHLYRQSLTQNILQRDSVRRSWDCGIFFRYDDSRLLDFENGFGVNRNACFVEDCAIGDAENENDPSVQGQKNVR